MVPFSPGTNLGEFGLLKSGGGIGLRLWVKLEFAPQYTRMVPKWPLAGLHLMCRSHVQRPSPQVNDVLGNFTDNYPRRVAWCC